MYSTSLLSLYLGGLGAEVGHAVHVILVHMPAIAACITIYSINNVITKTDIKQQNCEVMKCMIDLKMFDQMSSGTFLG